MSHHNICFSKRRIDGRGPASLNFGMTPTIDNVAAHPNKKVAPKRGPKRPCFTDDQTAPQGSCYGATYLFECLKDQFSRHRTHLLTVELTCSPLHRWRGFRLPQTAGICRNLLPEGRPPSPTAGRLTEGPFSRHATQLLTVELTHSLLKGIKAATNCRNLQEPAAKRKASFSYCRQADSCTYCFTVCRGIHLHNSHGNVNTTFFMLESILLRVNCVVEW